MNPGELVHVCCYCGRERNPEGDWHVYIRKHHAPDAQLTHGICMGCVERHYPEYAAEFSEYLTPRRSSAHR